MIDWSRVKELEDDMGAEDLGDVVAIFLDEMEEAIEDMVAQPPNSSEEWASRMHFLKGSAFNLGFEAFGAYCGGGETAARAGDVDGLTVAELRARYDVSKSAFIADFSNNSTAILEVA
ncbi:MAG: Hpt domain-containing protein [Pseudomonadota bacterium]